MQTMRASIRDGVTNTGIGVTDGRIPVRKNVILGWFSTRTDLIEFGSGQDPRDDPRTVDLA